MQESVLINRLEKKNLMSTIEPEDDQAEIQTTAGDRDYEYLLSMSLWFLSYEKINELKAQSLLKQEQMTKLQSTTPTDLWEEDLKKFEEALAEQVI
jgi:DNA topoisomerase II